MTDTPQEPGQLGDPKLGIPGPAEKQPAEEPDEETGINEDEEV